MYDAGKVGLTMEGLHDSTRTYEKLSVVTNTEKTKLYISKKNVPSGVAITNTEYWEESMNNNSVSLDWEHVADISTGGEIWTHSVHADMKYEYLAVARGMSVKVNTEYESHKSSVWYQTVEEGSTTFRVIYFSMEVDIDDTENDIIYIVMDSTDDSAMHFEGTLYRRPITEHLLEPEEA